MTPTNSPQNPRQIILDALHHLDHVLPGQAPIHDFVHHNTLHGFQHLPFEQALREFSELTGISCYLSAEQFRAFYAKGRISDADLDAALNKHLGDCGQTIISSLDGQNITKKHLYRLALLCELPVLTPAEWTWQSQESGVFDRDGLPKKLWDSLLSKLELKMPDLHSEQLLDLSREQAESWLSAIDSGEVANERQKMRQHSLEQVQALFGKVGDALSLRSLVHALSGVDILDSVRPLLIRWCSSLLDEGMAAWRLPQRNTLGLYQAWLNTADYDVWPIFQELPDWQNLKAQLPEDSIEAIIQQLQLLAIPVDRWPGYLQRLALEIPGWSGLINWRETHPNYQADDNTQPILADYLALRLILDRLYLQSLCRELWHCEARFDKLQAYFTKNHAEFAVRQALFSGQLPEYLAQAAQSHLIAPTSWQTLAERIRIWELSPLNAKLSVYQHGWRLFLACQWLGLSSEQIQRINQADLLSWLEIIDQFDEQQRGYVWLNAYERHYQQNLLQALHANHQRGRWAQREQRPEAQVYFCMDEREESFRRHLEELNPGIETLGVAGFFGLAINYKAIDAHHATPLCPVVVTPAHQVNEVIKSEQEKQFSAHQQGLKIANGLADLLFQRLRSSPIWAYPLQFFFAPIKLWQLLGHSLLPTHQHHLEYSFNRLLIPSVSTQLNFISVDPTPASPQAPKLGFSDQEQAEKVALFLKSTGLTYGFAKIVALIGHGSTSQNNPHEAAHDCGACGGRQGGPNARLFAAMANRTVVRNLLANQGIHIPNDTWFVGAQHDTCSDVMMWFDLEQIPQNMQIEFNHFKQTILKADSLAARERCRRFASANSPDSASSAIRHVENRALDLSQVRPEFGHATNAAAFIGRRSATQGVFFDRRLFLISYDPTQDADGKILENILLTAGPVGAGINLEYYFSSVNNERLGCGTKIPHNVTGLFGVMEGTISDLRTGLPLQMVEIHEAMRLQIVVEAKTQVLEAIYARQESLQELIGGGWVHVCSKDPDSGEIFVFERGIGFVPWQTDSQEIPLRNDSLDCYRDESQPVPAMLIKQPNFPSVAS
jgi:uncharacterized protein YbcC (UPF0753/DUF2309 family)